MVRACNAAVRVDARLRIGLTGTSVVAAAGDVSTEALRGRPGVGG